MIGITRYIREKNDCLLLLAWHKKREGRVRQRGRGRKKEEEGGRR